MPVHKSASVTLFDDKRTPASGPRTVVVFGVTRGGTSMIAGAVRGFGVFLGDNLPVNNEDPDFTYKSLPLMKASILARNEKFQSWGWKFPMAANYMEELMPVLRNPVFVIVARDIAATASALTRWHNRDRSAALSEALMQTQKNFMLALRWQTPTLFVSYERAVASPDVCLDELASFLDTPLTVDRSKLIDFMARGSYKSFEEVVLGAPPKA
jgi:hypothetical protein